MMYVYIDNGTNLSNFIIYTVCTYNFGNKNLTNISVTNTKSEFSFCASFHPNILLPRTCHCCNYTYNITQNDIDS